jgi:hypothetical protein
MEIPGLAYQTGSLGPGAQDGRQPGVVAGAASLAAGHPEGHHARTGEVWQGIEEPASSVGFAPWPAGLDIVHAQPVQRLGDGDLVGHAEIDALGLGPVAQRGVEEIDSVGLAHGARIIVSGYLGRYAL